MQVFRAISILEGLSYLVILSVTLGWISRSLVFPLGMGHGVLFVLYLVLSLQVSHKQKWSVVTWLLVLLAAVVPFAFIAVEFFLQKESLKNLSQAT